MSGPVGCTNECAVQWIERFKIELVQRLLHDGEVRTFLHYRISNSPLRLFNITYNRWLHTIHYDNRNFIDTFLK